MKRRISGAAILIMFLAAGGLIQGFSSETETIPVSERIPAPSEMSVRQIVTGRISTLQHIDIFNVGKKIPETYSEGKVFNTPGYDWYVSRHFALKTNLPDPEVRLYLELLEMAYPHYIEIFGAEPPAIRTHRLAVVYSPTHFDAKTAMMDDGIQRGPGGGGETMFFNRVAYNFKSSRQQHQRYIVLHETTHAFQMAVMEYTGWFPEWFVEGVADSVAHHIYDPREKRLQVMNFDRGSPMDYIRLGLEEYEKLNHPSIEDITLRSDYYRGINFLIIHFMLDNPRRSHLLKIYRDEMTKLRLRRDEARKKSVEVLKSVFGDWAAVETEFAEFVKTVDKSFNVAGGPWEQEGNSYFVRIDNADNGLPRLDFLFKPGDKPFYKPFKVDQPVLLPCRLIGPIGRGTSEPGLGLKIDYQADHLHRGKAGMGFGLFVTEASRKKNEADKTKKPDEKKSYDPNEDELYEIVIEDGKTLVFNGKDFGGERLAFPLPPGFIGALESQAQPELGMTVTLRQSVIEAILRTGEQADIQYTASVPISADVRAKLMDRNMAIIAENASHRLTPYFDDGRDLNPYPVDYKAPAPNNAFRNPADKETTRLTDAIRLLGGRAPKAAVNLWNALIAASDKGPARQAEAYKRLRNERLGTVSKIAASSGISSEKAAAALRAFAGTTVRFVWATADADGKRPVSIVICNPSDLPLTGDLSMTVLKDGVVIDKLEKQSFAVDADGSFAVPYTAPPYRDEQRLHYKTNVTVRWAGQSFRWEEDFSDPYPWSTLEIVKPARVENGEIHIAALLRGPLDGETKGRLFMEVMPAFAVEKALLVEDVTVNPLEVKTFERSFKIKDGADLSKAAVNVRFELSVDEEPIIMERRSFIEQAFPFQ